MQNTLSIAIIIYKNLLINSLEFYNWNTDACKGL